MQAGLVSVSFRALAPEEILSLAARCGLENIEWGGDVHVPCGDLARARQVGEQTRASGLEVACYGSYDRLTAGAHAPEAVVATAKALGAPLIRVWAGTCGSADATEEQRAEVVRNAQRLGDLAEAEGMDVAFEYHGGTLTDDPASALALLRAVDRNNVGCLWQPPVGLSAQDCLRGLRMVAPYVRNIHVFSWQGTQRLPLAEGQAKWAALLPEIARLPGDRRLLLEFVRGDDPGQLPVDAACLKKWLEEYDG